MKTQRFVTIILLLALFQHFLYGQANEHSLLNATPDSIPKKQNCKASEIVGIALPAAMITYGIISQGDNGIRQIDYNVRNSITQSYGFHFEDYLQFAPAAAAYAMKFSGVKSRHDLLDMTVLYGLSNLVGGGITLGTKLKVGRMRPDNSDRQSFPSGHTETAFVAAEFLHQEFKDQSVWISVGGYTAATVVGVARIYHDKHWFSDVVTGAGIGILSTKAVYWVYPYIQKIFRKCDIYDKYDKKHNPDYRQTFIFPGYSNGNLCLTLSKTF
ncbi:MAG: phosphatase PAP2 family protein [Candidatus Azobacteroides sp.]|nr:phosphatase PAP2 family protein [Candidatus Azobacteroides sp.]